MENSVEEWREAIAVNQRLQSNGGEAMQYARTTSAACYKPPWSHQERKSSLSFFAGCSGRPGLFWPSWSVGFLS